MSKIVRISELIIPKFYPEYTDKRKTHHILSSGRAGTKSSEASIKAVDKIVSEENCSVIIIRKFHNKIKKTVYKEVLRAIKRLGLQKKDFKITTAPMEIRYKRNGNTIYFTGSDSIDDTKGIIDEEKPIKLVVIDEVTEFFDKGEGEDELRNIEATFVRGNNEDFTMLYLFNPPRNPKAPVNEWRNKMAERPDCLAIHTDYRDVPEEWLGKKLVESAEQEKQADEKMYRWLWLGESVGIDEVIYYMFDESKHMMDTSEKYKDMAIVGIGIDYGQMNATTFQAFGLSFKDKKIYGIDEYYHSGRETMKQRSPSQYAADFKGFKERIEKETTKKVTFVYIDPSARGLAEEIKRVSPDVQIIGADNDVKLGIQRVSKLLAYNALIFSTRQTHLRDEMYLYMYNKDLLDKGREEPIKDHDHCITGDTLIETTEGKKRIDELVGKTGRVYCHSKLFKKLTTAKFFNVRKTVENAMVYEVEMEDETKIKATGSHKFLTTKGWKRLDELDQEDMILRHIARTDVDLQQFQEVATPTKIKSIKYIGTEDVYNMTVKRHHNYLVNGGFILHNCEDATRYLVQGFWSYIKQMLPNISDKTTEGGRNERE